MPPRCSISGFLRRLLVFSFLIFFWFAVHPRIPPMGRITCNGITRLPLFYWEIDRFGQHQAPL